LRVICGFAGCAACGLACATAGGFADAGFFTVIPAVGGGGDFCFGLRSMGGLGTAGFAACGLAAEAG
jgi:hypothetical protein